MAMRLHLENPRNLTPLEWQQVIQLFEFNKDLQIAFEILRERENTPQMANALYKGVLVCQLGQEYSNTHFRIRAIPFHLARIGRGLPRKRDERLLALVEWPQYAAKPSTKPPP